MTVIVRLDGGDVYEVKGDRWAEPPVQPSPIPGVVQADHEMTPREAADVHLELAACARDRRFLVQGQGYEYKPAEESLFIVVYQGTRKVAAFNPVGVTAVYVKHEADLVEDL